MLKKLVKEIVMGHKADCESYLAFLKRILFMREIRREK